MFEQTARETTQPSSDRSVEVDGHVEERFGALSGSDANKSAALWKMHNPGSKYLAS